MSLKIGIAGVGNVTLQNYLPYLAGQEGVQLGYWNRTAQAAVEAARKFGGDAFSSLSELAAWQPDTVLVLTSETARRDVAGELIRRGVKKLFLEKPLVAARGQAHVSESDFEDGRDLLALAENSGCETAMIFNYRFFDQTLAAKKAAEERKFGKVIHFSGQVHYACWSHCIDLLHHFAGGIEEVTALAGNIVRKGKVAEAADLVSAFRLKNGGAGTLIGTAGMAWQHPLFELVFTFEGGRIHLRDIDGTLEILDAKGQVHETRSMVRDASRWGSYDESFKRSLETYLVSLRERKEPPIPGIDGLRELQVEAGLRRSVAERRPVLLDQEFPLHPSSS